MSPFVDYDPAHYYLCHEPCAASAGTSSTADGKKRDNMWSHGWFAHDTMIYPSSDGGPIPSKRLAALRDGLEDWELMRMLPKETVERVVSPLASSATQWKDDL